MSGHPPRPRITAILGPTNTGKTYLAIERMLGHATGMIGFPLRLLARENYDRIARIKGASQVALITGEEKIIPPHARYFVCTVESMPLDHRVDFLAVDEIQMCADPERGHVFTDRLLRARGDVETMFLGAATIQPILRKLVPDAEFISRPRLSKLTYIGPRKITRLRPRSAVVAFSVSDVYEIAELLRRQRGGTAVVLGALSPRTRNAQVDMYQEGEVDYLVATDAIGMGLNMNVDHVAFYRLRKFDGRNARRLTPSEIAQIAGRAGRHTSDGTFGTVAELGPLDAELVEAVEDHRFDPLTVIQWRNSDLEFRSAVALLRSLEARPSRPELVRARQADDQIALAALTRDPDIKALATNPEAVRRLWDVCQIPDFRKTMADVHARLLARIYKHLMTPEERLPTDWVADQVTRLDRVDGDIDTLMARIAHVRTWTFISHRADWLDDAAHWQQRARSIEDKLSDALHERLTQRFVDRRAAALTRLKDKPSLDALVEADGDVIVEGQFVGRLDGFRFVPDTHASAAERRQLIGAANRVLRGEIAARIARLEADPQDAFSIGDDGAVGWHGETVARLRAGEFVLAPQIDVVAGDMTAEQRERVRTRLVAVLDSELKDVLGPLMQIMDAEISGAARGIVYQLAENLGSFDRRRAHDQTSVLDAESKAALRALGVRLGHESIYLPALLRPKAARMRGLLWSVHQKGTMTDLPAPGLVTVTLGESDDPAFLEACGYRVTGNRAVRIDMLDRLAIRLRRLSRQGRFAVPADLLNLVGLTAEQATPVLAALGYRPVEGEAELVFEFAPRRKPAKKPKKKTESARKRRPRRRDRIDPDSPFAKLRELQSP